MKLKFVTRLYAAMGVLLFASQIPGCNSPTTLPEPDESSVVSELQALGPEIIKGSGYSTTSTTLQLKNGEWVAEMMTFDNLRWDYRRTASKEMPYQGIVGCKVGRWITKPFGTKELAETAAKDGKGFFQTNVESFSARTFPSEQPEHVNYSYSVTELVSETVFDARAGSWVLKGVQFCTSYNDFAKQKELWAKQFAPTEKPTKNEPATTSPKSPN